MCQFLAILCSLAPEGLNSAATQSKVTLCSCLEQYSVKKTLCAVSFCKRGCLSVFMEQKQ